MAYKALYRAYRPTTFEEVVGQQHIVKTLKNALQTGKIAHAYLFAGPRGTGKTTMAKLFAKALNCENGIGEQCNECKNCVAINEGSHPDVLELDAASNNGVDEIRNLIDKVKYGTILGRYKVYIIDEVHMLSVGAFNALLKTLEEPPEHVIFILATTEPHKILPTILSRCQRYDFTKISNEDIKERIKVVLESENISYNEDAIDLIISLCDGGMRDALSILDQVLAYSGNKLNTQDILDIFSLESLTEKVNLIKAIANKDSYDVLTRTNSYFTKGTDIKRLTDDLLVLLKDVLIYQNCKNVDYLELLTEPVAEELSSLLTNGQIISMIEILMSTLKDLKNVTAINPLFEVTMLKMVALDNSASSAPVINKPAENKVTPIVNKPITPVVEEKKVEEVIEQPIAPTPSIRMLDKSELIKLKGTVNGDKYFIDSDLLIKIMVTSKKEIKNAVMDKWSALKKWSLHPILGKYASLLIDGHPLVANSKVLIVECPLPKVAEAIQETSNQDGLQTLSKEVFQEQMFIYGITRKESIESQQKYMNLKQISKLPKANEIKLEFEEE